MSKAQRRRMQRIEAVLKPPPPEPRLTTIVVDEDGVIVNLGAYPDSAEAAFKKEWLGRHHSEVPRHPCATVVGGIDLDVVLGRKPGIPADRINSASFKVIGGKLVDSEATLAKEQPDA
jgi:hypothetical protein